jgi:molybdopterin molybdotransferase
MISFEKAYHLSLENVQTLETELVGLVAAVGRLPSIDLLASVDSPSVDASLKDGYAVHSDDIHDARPDHPVALRLVGVAEAGGSWQGELQHGEALRILSGAPLPTGADAILTEELATEQAGQVIATGDAHVGRNIIARASDVRKGQVLAAAGEKLLPSKVGLLAAGGLDIVPVIRQPRVAIIATGDEVIFPGQPLKMGGLYASNLVTLAAWCAWFGFSVETYLVGDVEKNIRAQLQQSIIEHDVILTSGGAWKGEKDLTVRTLDEMGWQKIYHRVKMGPGKAIGFGIFQNKPVFCLPGGPPSNHMAFLQLALPALQKMAGFKQPGLAHITARLSETISGQVDWTQFIHGKLVERDGTKCFYARQPASRLQMIAHTEALAMIPEGQVEIRKDSLVQVQVLI